LIGLPDVTGSKEKKRRSEAQVKALQLLLLRRTAKFMLAAGGICFLIDIYFGPGVPAAPLLFMSGSAGGILGFLALFLSHHLARSRLRAGAAREARAKE
jgi:hypothetical protein